MSPDTRSRNPSTKISDLLRPGPSGVGKLAARAREINRLSQTLENLLDPRIATATRVATMDGNCLVLVTPSATVAMRLRLDSAHLVRALNASGEKAIRSIRVHVAPIEPEKPPGRRKRKRSVAARRFLDEWAAGNRQSREPDR